MKKKRRRKKRRRKRRNRRRLWVSGRMRANQRPLTRMERTSRRSIT